MVDAVACHLGSHTTPDAGKVTAVGAASPGAYWDTQSPVVESQSRGIPAHVAVA